MAEIPTITEISVVEDVVCKVESGTGKRRFTVFVRGTTTATSNTLDLSTYLLGSGISGIEGPVNEQIDEAVAATASTFATTIITFASHAGSGRYSGTWTCYA